MGSVFKPMEAKRDKIEQTLIALGVEENKTYIGPIQSTWAEVRQLQQILVEETKNLGYIEVVPMFNIFKKGNLHEQSSLRYHQGGGFHGGTI